MVDYSVSDLKGTNFYMYVFVVLIATATVYTVATYMCGTFMHTCVQNVAHILSIHHATCMCTVCVYTCTMQTLPRTRTCGNAPENTWGIFGLSLF
jgi:hypothetical protein